MGEAKAEGAEEVDASARGRAAEGGRGMTGGLAPAGEEEVVVRGDAGAEKVTGTGEIVSNAAGVTTGEVADSVTADVEEAATAAVGTGAVGEEGDGRATVTGIRFRCPPVSWPR